MQNYPTPVNNYQYYPTQGPNAVSINIYSPQAYGNAQTTAPVCSPPCGGYYSMYGQNTKPNLPLYPANYNNVIEKPQENTVLDNKTNLLNETTSKTSVSDEQSKTTTTEEKKDEKKKTKLITPLTDQYVMSLENYLNDPNPKVRLIGAKELLERLKEDETRKDNPSLIPLVNKVIQDKSAAVRFLGLTMLQLDYCVGDDTTVEILKQIQTQNKDKIGEDQLLASEILLKMSAPNKVEVQEGTK